MVEGFPIGPGDVATASLFLMMAAMGMGLRPSDFAQVVRHPAAFACGSVGQLVLLPLAAFLFADALGLEPHVAIGLVLIAACPGGVTSNAFSQFARGDVALSVSLTALSSGLSFLTVPLFVGWAIQVFAGRSVGVELPFEETALRLCTTTALPLVLGMVVRRGWPTFAERLRAPLLFGSTVVVILLVAGLGASLSGGDAARLLAGTGPAVAALIATMAGLALLGSRLLGLRGPQRRTIVLELSIQNFNLAMVVALGLLGDRLYLGPALVYLPVMLLFAAGVLVLAQGKRALASPAD